MRSVGSVLWCSRNRPLWRPTGVISRWIVVDWRFGVFQRRRSRRPPSCRRRRSITCTPSSLSPQSGYTDRILAHTRTAVSSPDPHSDRDLCTRVMDSLARRPAPARRARCGHGHHARRRRGPGDGRRAAGAQGPGRGEGRLLVRAGQRTARAVSTTRARRRLPTGAITPRCAEP